MTKLTRQVLDERDFDNWSPEEQRALTTLMGYKVPSGTTPRVVEAFSELTILVVK